MIYIWLCGKIFEGFFLGLAHLISGTNDFNKIIKMISDGDNLNVDDI